MKYSLINVTKENGNKVSGYWIQDCFDWNDPVKCARETNEVNGNRLNIAIVESVNSVTPMLDYFTDLERVIVQASK
jgi:hypothetical protein